MVTIAIPVYNVEPYIREALHSAFTQTYKDIKVLVVDDCGTDKSMDIVREVIAQYPDIKSRVMAHARNLGLGQARNTAIQACDTEWLLFLDGDDVMPQTAVGRLVEAAERDGSELVIGSSDALNATDARRSAHCALPRMRLEREHAGMYLKGRLATWLNTEAWGKLYKTSLLKDNNILAMHPELEDMMLFMQVGYCANNISTIPDVTYIYRRREGSICRSNWAEPGRRRLLSDIKRDVEYYKFTHPCEGILEVKDHMVSIINRFAKC